MQKAALGQAWTKTGWDPRVLLGCGGTRGLLRCCDPCSAIPTEGLKDVCCELCPCLPEYRELCIGTLTAHTTT